MPIFDSEVTGKSVTTPSTGMVIGKIYTIFVGSGVITSNTIRVPSGVSLNGTVNGTYTLTRLLSGWVNVSVIWDGSGWFAAP